MQQNLNLELGLLKLPTTLHKVQFPLDLHDLVFLSHLLSANTNLVNSESLLTQANFTFPRLICTLLNLQLLIFHE